MANIYSGADPSEHARTDSPEPDLFPELVPDLPQLALLRSYKIWEANLWIGGDRVVTGLHFDEPENMMAVIRGAKTFYLFPPEQTPNIYPTSLTDPHPTADHVSDVDLVDPDFNRFPRLRRSRCLRATVEAGELLYLPSGYWHFVETSGPCIGVNFWWYHRAANVKRYLRSPLNRIWMRKAWCAGNRLLGARYRTPSTTT